MAFDLSGNFGANQRPGHHTTNHFTYTIAHSSAHHSHPDQNTHKSSKQNAIQESI
jgi:hypothetical protein